jgi:hypothetical protein
MLSRRTKSRIKRNKQRRIQCRTKDGRDLVHLIRTTKRRVTNQAVKLLLKMANGFASVKYQDTVLGITRYVLAPPQGNLAPTNPNNCTTCDHKQNPDGGWCYMFRDEATEVCLHHTGRKAAGLIFHFQGEHSGTKTGSRTSERR